MQIQLNGKPFDTQVSSLSGLIRQLDLEGKRFAVEVNEKLIPRSEHAGSRLHEGDRVEIVQAIGGG